MSWMTGSGIASDWDAVISDAKQHTDRGGGIYVGCDSHYASGMCTYAVAVCLHGAEGQQGGRYYFLRDKVPMTGGKALMWLRITEEANRAVAAAITLMNNAPEAHIEVHLDVSSDRKQASGSLSESLSGYARAAGFVCKIKPAGWAASSIADGHTR